jgi:glycosyltransferase involved in cell wall biosynthesis
MIPRVSICIPNYNYGCYLPEALESVLEQTYADFELIIIDNCSTDDSREVISKYAKQDPRISFRINEQNLGMVNNLNRCLHEAKGEYVKCLFSDDRFASRDALQKMVAVMESDSSISLVASARFVIDDRSNIVKLLSPYGRRDIVLSGVEVIRDCLLEQRNHIGEPSVVLFRRAQAMRGFDARYRQFVDLAMWMRLLEHGNFAYLHEPLCSFRVHDRQETAGNLEKNVHIDEQVLLAHDLGENPLLTLTSLERAHMRFIPARNIWKLYRRYGKISRETARQRIAMLYNGNLPAFYLFFPVYRMYKLYLSIMRRIMLLTARRLNP